MTTKQQQCLLAFLGYYTGAIDNIWGDQSRKATENFQRDFGLTPDGVFGVGTEERIRQAIGNYDDLVLDLTGKEDVTDTNVGGKPQTGDYWDEIEYFTREEFRCQCGGKYCDGYPHEIQPLLMQILDRARRWSGHPIKVISGLRCEKWNSIQGGVANSQHKYGEAVDVYFYGVTPGAALAWLQSQPDVRYAYQISGCSNIHFDIHKVGR